MTSTPKDLEILTADDVARLLGLSRNSVYLGAARGEIPHRRVGRRIIFSRTAIVAWLESQGRAAPGRE